MLTNITIFSSKLFEHDSTLYGQKQLFGDMYYIWTKMCFAPVRRLDVTAKVCPAIWWVDLPDPPVVPHGSVTRISLIRWNKARTNSVGTLSSWTVTEPSTYRKAKPSSFYLNPRRTILPGFPSPISSLSHRKPKMTIAPFSHSFVF